MNRTVLEYQTYLKASTTEVAGERFVSSMFAAMSDEV